MKYIIESLNINIRNARINDIDSIMDIEPEAFGKHHWSKQSFTNEFSNAYSRYFIAETNTLESKLIGYIGYWIIQDEGHITTLAVSPFYKRNHVADILLYTLITDAILNSIKWLTLEVRVGNIAAIKLYRKYNFKQLGLRKNYYQDNNEDALILWTEKIDTDEYKSLLDSNLTSITNPSGTTDKYQYSVRN